MFIKQNSLNTIISENKKIPYNNFIAARQNAEIKEVKQYTQLVVDLLKIPLLFWRTYVAVILVLK